MRDQGAMQPQPPMALTDVLTESNHRVANHLENIVLLARKQAARIKAGPELIPRESAVEALNSLASTTAAIATLHRRLATHPTHDRLDLGDLVRDMLQELKTLYGDRLRVGVTIESGCTVDATRASILAFALSEAVTNAIKYAHPTGLPIEMTVAAGSPRDGGLILEIADDGVGLPEGFDHDRDAGVGFKMLHYMVEGAGGRLTTSSDELGLRFFFELPPDLDPA
jgi:two-component sensor histidine kinase